MTEQVPFSTEGEFMTNFARKKLYAENDFDGAIKFLMDCMETNQLTVDERYQRALAILDGTKCLKGTYPYEDYGHYDEENPKHILGEYFRKQNQRLAKMRSENNDLLYKYLNLYERSNSSEHRESEQLSVNRETGMQRIKQQTETLAEAEKHASIYDYDGNIFSHAEYSNDLMGFIEPDGTFHQVDWCHHDEWAKDYLDANYDLYDKDADLQVRRIDGQEILMCNSDVLVYSLHWVLLDNPSKNGIPSPTYDEAYGLTKKQKERLFDFYLATGQEKKAKELYE